ncbi:reverse transcriptase N-terminal domain-containing protein [Nonomuraea jabiensis]|uniref:reverse transcriptase N-terminal domain-containing protein n=1 Tax=Nonomuraea jabiensis TaxID=882448 RepID=UPI003D729E30
MVNGPEGVHLDWEAVDWRLHEENVRRLRQRIFKAAQEQDWPKVRSLQKLMLRSWSNTLVSVRQATQRNAGRKTAGVDGQVALTSPARTELVVRVIVMPRLGDLGRSSACIYLRRVNVRSSGRSGFR